MIYETPRLVVRQWADGDTDRLFDIYRRWEVARWLGATPKALETREQAVNAVRRFADWSEDPTYGVWAVEVRDTGVVAGSVLLVPLPGDTGEVEVGWHLHPDSWGHGYATEAAKGALDRAWAAGLTEVFAVVRPGNDASMAVCRRLGMEHLGTTTKGYDVEAETFRIARE